MKEVTICLKTLFNELSKQNQKGNCVFTEYGHIEKSFDSNDEYFDFKTEKGTPCMDGETCEILEETECYVLLQEKNEQIPFKLSREEFVVASIIVD